MTPPLLLPLPACLSVSLLCLSCGPTTNLLPRPSCLDGGSLGGVGGDVDDATVVLGLLLLLRPALLAVAVVVVVEGRGNRGEARVHLPRPTPPGRHTSASPPQ